MSSSFCEGHELGEYETHVCVCVCLNGFTNAMRLYCESNIQIWTCHNVFINLYYKSFFYVYLLLQIMSLKTHSLACSKCTGNKIIFHLFQRDVSYFWWALLLLLCCCFFWQTFFVSYRPVIRNLSGCDLLVTTMTQSSLELFAQCQRLEEQRIHVSNC